MSEANDAASPWLESTPDPEGVKKTRGGRRQRQKPVTPIETANNTPDEDFLNEYVKPSSGGWPQWTHPSTNAAYALSLSGPGDLCDEELDACFNLVDETSGADYRNSSFGWHVAIKKKEMRSPDLRYILVKDADGVIKGFTSLMPTFENHEPVVYCYEIHLKPELQGTGLGTQLMGYLTAAAENIPTIEKVMLTCFTSNTAGLKFYEKLGFDRDDHSPRERKLRGGKTIVPDYVILSQRTTTGSTANSRQRRRQQ